jgi:hypothetical protein
MTSNTNTGREAGRIANTLAGMQGGDMKDKGLKGAAPESVAPLLQGTDKHKKSPQDDVPSNEATRMSNGDVEKINPSNPVQSAKQQMDRERKSAYESATRSKVAFNPGFTSDKDNRPFL